MRHPSATELACLAALTVSSMVTTLLPALPAAPLNAVRYETSNGSWVNVDPNATSPPPVIPSVPGAAQAMPEAPGSNAVAPSQAPLAVAPSQEPLAVAPLAGSSPSPAPMAQLVGNSPAPGSGHGPAPLPGSGPVTTSSPSPASSPVPATEQQLSPSLAPGAAPASFAASELPFPASSSGLVQTPPGAPQGALSHPPSLAHCLVCSSALCFPAVCFTARVARVPRLQFTSHSFLLHARPQPSPFWRPVPRGLTQLYPSAGNANFTCPSLVSCSPILPRCSAVSPAHPQHRQHPDSSHAPASIRCWHSLNQHRQHHNAGSLRPVWGHC